MKCMYAMRYPAAFILVLVLMLSLSGCFGLGNMPGPAEQNITDEAAVPQTEDFQEQQAEKADDREVLFSAGGVTVKAETPDLQSENPALTLFFENTTGKSVNWTIETLTLDGFEIPLGSECSIPAGERSQYAFPLNSQLVSMLLGAGEHTVSVSSVLSDETGNTLARADSDTITVRFG